MMDIFRTSTPEPAAKVGALQAFGLATLNVFALLAEIGPELTAALNVLVAAAILVIDVFWLRRRVTPMEGLHERLQAPKPPEFP